MQSRTIPPRLQVPDFIVIGAMRSATTSLHHYLSAHPAINMSREKETDFFIAERNFDRGLEWYARLFDRHRSFCGESSPNYSKRHIFPGVAERIHTHAPNCRLIYIVRDPIERALSQYSFALSQMPAGHMLNESQINDLILTSCYYYQIDEYMSHFSVDQIYVLDYSDINSRPREALTRIARHIGFEGDWGPVERETINSSVELSRMPQWFFRLRENRLVSDLRRSLPPGVVGPLRRMLATGPDRKIPPASPELIERIRRTVTPDAARFRELVGQPFDAWSV